MRLRWRILPQWKPWIPMLPLRNQTLLCLQPQKARSLHHMPPRCHSQCFGQHLRLLDRFLREQRNLYQVRCQVLIMQSRRILRHLLWFEQRHQQQLQLYRRFLRCRSRQVRCLQPILRHLLKLFCLRLLRCQKVQNHQGQHLRLPRRILRTRLRKRNQDLHQVFFRMQDLRWKRHPMLIMRFIHQQSRRLRQFGSQNLHLQSRLPRPRRRSLRSKQLQVRQVLLSMRSRSRPLYPMPSLSQQSDQTPRTHLCLCRWILRGQGRNLQAMLWRLLKVFVCHKMWRLCCPSHQQRWRNMQMRSRNFLRSLSQQRQILPTMYPILRQVRKLTYMPSLQEWIRPFSWQHLHLSKEQLHQSKGRVRPMQSRMRNLLPRHHLRKVHRSFGRWRKQLCCQVQPWLLFVRCQVSRMPSQLSRLYFN